MTLQSRLSRLGRHAEEALNDIGRAADRQFDRLTRWADRGLDHFFQRLGDVFVLYADIAIVLMVFGSLITSIAYALT